MGQAKLRGTREQRVEQAKVLAAEKEVAESAARAKREADENARLAAMPPKQRQSVVAQRRARRMNSIALVGLAAALAAIGSDDQRKA